MSRFSGPQFEGASRLVRETRRLEAEQRQAEEKKRDAERAAEYAAREAANPALAEPSAAELLAALGAVAALVAEDELRRLLGPTPAKAGAR